MNLTKDLTGQQVMDKFDRYLSLLPLTETTKSLYKRALKNYVTNYEQTFDGVNKFILDRAKENRSVYVRSVMMHFLEMMDHFKLKRRLIRIKTREPRKEAIYHNKDTLMVIISHIEGIDNMLISLLQLATGVRPMDAIRLRKDGIGEKEDGLYIRFLLKGEKQSEPKYIPLEISKRLKEHVQKKEGLYVFLETDDKNLKELTKMYIRYWREVKKAGELAGIDGFSPKGFRSSFATDFYEASNKDIIATQKAMNHSSVTTTMRYIASLNQDRVKIVKDIRGN